MTNESIDMLAPERLARLLDVDVPGTWSDADTAAALRHQLGAPLWPDVAAAPGTEVERIRPLAEAHPSLLAALTCPGPSLELLQAIKRWARHLSGEAASPLSRGPATLLYYAAIAAARLRLNQSITSLTAAQLEEGFRWSAGYAGAEPLAEFFTQALRGLPSA